MSGSGSKPSSSSAAAASGDSRWKRWGKTAFDKSIVVSDWAAGYANGASAKMGGERFWPKSNDFPEEITKCERILRAFTVEGIQASKTEESTVATTDAAGKSTFMTKKRKVLRKIPPKVMQRAKGIVIYTAMRSGIAPFGGAGGAGLMLARRPDGSWSAPSSISPNNLSVGLLLGFDIFDVILVINTEKAMEAFKSHKVTLGAETAVAAGPFGAGISGEMGFDRIPVYSYVRSRGLYGGVEAMAQAFLHRFDENERIYYWPGVTASDIFEGKVRTPPIVEPLYRALRDAETGIAQGDSLERTVYETVHAPPNVAVNELQGESSAVLIEEGERLRLPPTPEELEALEQAGIPDDFDLALDKKMQEEAKLAAAREREEIFSLPPPPRHRTVDKYWSNRGANRGGKRRVAPAHHETASSGQHSPSEPDHEALSEINLDDTPKPPLPTRPPPDAVKATEPLLAPDDGLPAYADGSLAVTTAGSREVKTGGTAVDIGTPADLISMDGLAEKAGSESGSLASVSPTPIDASSSQGHDRASAATLGGESMSRSGSLSTPPSRPPRRAATAAALKQSQMADTPSMAKMIVLMDWDETISAHDTLALVAPPPGTQMLGPDFSSYTDAYMSDMDEYTKSFGERDTLERQMAFLEGLDTVEQMSVARVESGQLFKGVSMADLLSRAKTVELREGWNVFRSWLEDQTKAGSVVSHIISVGWSAKFIQKAIEHATGRDNLLAPINVYANEVEMDADGLGTGKLTKSNAAASHNTDDAGNSIRTGIHKRVILENTLSSVQIQNAASSAPVSVYIGDSNTDLPCLLRVDYGLLMGGNESLLSTIRRVGLGSSLVSAADFQVGHSRERTPVLITVQDWNEALDVLKRIHYASASP